MDLGAIIKEKRPLITESSVRTYKSNLYNIFRRCYEHGEEMTMAKFADYDKIIPVIKDDPINTRRTKLASLVVLTGNEKYLKYTLDDIKTLKHEALKQEKTPAQKEGMISFDEVQQVYNNLEAIAKIHLAKKSIVKAERNDIQKWVLVALTSGIFIPPRRSADWNMKLKNIDEKKDNFLDIKAGQFVFNNYKTAKVYGQTRVDIPKPLKLILNKWLKLNDTDYLLFDTGNKPLSSPQIAHRLNEIFGKKISTSMLRHIFLTHKFGNVNLQELDDTAEAMGTSKMEALQYVKHDK